MNNHASPWYALHVIPRHERATAAHLALRDIEEFSPIYRVKRRWSDRLKEVDLPLFARYIFCRFRPEQRVTVLKTPGVQSIVGFGGVPAEISDAEIESVRTIIRSGHPYGPWPYVRLGDRVRIEQGCMRGLSGALVKERNEWRVIVNVEMLNRSVAVEIDRDMLSRDKVA